MIHGVSVSRPRYHRVGEGRCLSFSVGKHFSKVVCRIVDEGNMERGLSTGKTGGERKGPRSVAHLHGYVRKMHTEIGDVRPGRQGCGTSPKGHDKPELPLLKKTMNSPLDPAETATGFVPVPLETDRFFSPFTIRFSLSTIFPLSPGNNSDAVRTGTTTKYAPREVTPFGKFTCKAHIT